jgi:hypothetical protein
MHCLVPRNFSRSNALNARLTTTLQNRIQRPIVRRMSPKEEAMGKAILLCFILAASLSALAGDTKDKDKVRDLTGCLSKGDDAKEFVLTATDGSTWEVRSDKVQLAEHVGHTVTATGVVSNAKMHNLKEDAKEAAKDTGIKKSDAEHGHLTVTDVKMVSDSCK